MHGVRTIILAGHGASVTAEAIRWCAGEGVALYLMELHGEAFAIATEAFEADARRRGLEHRLKQFAAVLDPHKRLDIARKIVRAKLRTLDLHPHDARAFRQELIDARKLEDILTAEARAGAAYFMHWRGLEMRFKQREPAPFIARAGTFLKGRRGTSKARHAATPWGAILNYAYTVALGQCTRAIVGAGLDPCFGFLHSQKPGRLSLSYDVLELHRAAITRAVFEYGNSRIFRPDDFETDKHGVVRLGPPVAKEVAALALRAVPMAKASMTVRSLFRW